MARDLSGLAPELGSQFSVRAAPTYDSLKKIFFNSLQAQSLFRYQPRLQFFKAWSPLGSPTWPLRGSWGNLTRNHPSPAEGHPVRGSWGQPVGSPRLEATPGSFHVARSSVSP